MQLKRTARMLAGGGCLGAALITVVPHMTQYISQAAVVNAPILVYKSPFNGSVASVSLPPSTPVLPATNALELRATRSSRTELAHMKGQITTLNKELVALEGQIEALQHLDHDLANRMEQVKDLARRILNAKIDGLRGELAAAHERQGRLEREATRLSQLLSSGAAAISKTDSAVSLAAEAKGEVIRLSAAIDQ